MFDFSFGYGMWIGWFKQIYTLLLILGFLGLIVSNEAFTTSLQFQASGKLAWLFGEEEAGLLLAFYFSQINFNLLFIV